MIYCDSSFLLALCVPLTNWHEKAVDYDSRHLAGHSRIFNPWQRYELRHNLRAAVGRPEFRFTENDCLKVFSDVQADIDTGVLVHIAFSWTTLFNRAEALSDRHAGTIGAGTVDYWHVAFALEFEAEKFVTFDHAQWLLAKAEGLDAPKLTTS